MATIVEPEPATALEPATDTRSDATSRLRDHFAACRLQFRWLGTSKTLSSD